MQRRQTRTVNNSIDSSIKKPAVSKTMSTMRPGTTTTSNVRPVVQKKQTMTTAKKPMKYQVDLRSERNQSVNSNHYKSFDKAK